MIRIFLIFHEDNIHPFDAKATQKSFQYSLPLFVAKVTVATMRLQARNKHRLDTNLSYALTSNYAGDEVSIGKTGD